MQNFAYPAFPPNSPNSLGSNVGSHNSNAAEVVCLSDSQISEFSTQTRIENIELFKERTKNSVQKWYPWSVDDNKMLVSARLTISTDNIVGDGQTEKAFWKRVCAYYNKHRKSGPARMSSTIKGHWYWMLPMVNEFNQLYSKLLGEHHSGWSDDQLKDRARELYYQNRGKHFTLEYVWVILKDDPKWQVIKPPPRSSKRTKNNASGVYTSSSNVDTSVDDEAVEVEERPIGQKRAKEKGTSSKRKGKDTANKGGKFGTVWEEYSRIEQEKLNVAQDMQRYNDYEIMMRDTTNMTPEQFRTHEKICKILKAKYGLN